MTLLFQIYYYRIFYASRDQLNVPSERSALLSDSSESPKPEEQPKKLSRKQLVVEYTLLWCFVFAFGIGAFLYDRHGSRPSPQPDIPEGGGQGSDIFEWKSQVMGWLSALLYLGSRIPQIRTFFYARKLAP